MGGGGGGGALGLFGTGVSGCGERGAWIWWGRGFRRGWAVRGRLDGARTSRSLAGTRSSGLDV